MHHDTFIADVAQRAEIPPSQAESATCLTLNTLAQRITKGQAEQLSARLPHQLRECMAHEGPIEAFHLYEFLRRLKEQLGTDRTAAERVARAVLATLWTAVGPKEFGDLQSQLPGDFVPLLEAAVLDAPPRPPEEEPPFHGALSFNAFVDRVAERAGLDRDGARRAAEAVLEVLAMRVTHGQVDDLRPFLPHQLRPALDRGLTRSRGRALPLSLDAFVDEVVRREAVSREDAAAHARAVLSVLHEAAGDKEFSDTLAQLPREYRTLVTQQ